MKAIKRTSLVIVMVMLMLAGTGAGAWKAYGAAAGKGNSGLILDSMKAARQGKVIDIPFTAGKDCIEDVESKWGTPDSSDYVAKASGTYAVYGVKKAVFGYNKGMQIYEIRSMSTKIRRISLQEVKQTLGKPQVTRHFNGQVMLGYKAGSKFRLEFVFPNPGKKTANPGLDHMNVLYPAGTVNSMADYAGREW